MAWWTALAIAARTNGADFAQPLHSKRVAPHVSLFQKAALYVLNSRVSGVRCPLK